ncbi:ankyrin repeat domain-containing protein [soil metagenome]
MLLMFGCTSRDTTVDKSKLFGTDYRLFQGTAAWELAKAVEDGDAVKIRAEVNKNKNLLSFREARWGQSLLQVAVKTKKYRSVETLLALGADPNMQDLYYGDSPLMESAKIGSAMEGSDPRFLKLLLKHGGDPNAEQHGPMKTRDTPLMDACQQGNLDYVKILVNAGAKVNVINEYNDCPLERAVTQEYPDIVIYLIEKGADFKRVLYKTIPEGESKYITDGLRFWRFDLGSDEYKKKMQLVDFLKKNGLDYWKTPIPNTFLDEYPKEYLEKY